ncbi:MAG: glycosyltransferase [Methylococcaceae bacterium]
MTDPKITTNSTDVTMNSRIPTVSIGMPVYNGAEYIREALDSLLAQTFTDFELIISDNASNDTTQEICQKYAEQDSRIRYIRQSTNMGAMPNFTFVLHEARAEYFMWATHDDKLGTNVTLSNLVKSLDDGFELAAPDVDLFNETKGITDRGVLSSVFREQKRNSFTRLALKFPSYMVYGLFVTRCLRESYNYLEQSSDLPCFGEGVFVHAISANLKCSFIKNALLIYRRHSTNTSSTIIAPVLLKCFIKYSYRVFLFYLKSSYSIIDKLNYIIVLGWTHIKYILILLLSMVRFYLKSNFKKLRT